MNVIEFIVYVFNSVTGLNFAVFTLSEMSSFISTVDYWTKIFDINFIISFIIYFSIFFFVFKVTYQLFFRLFMRVVHFPKKWRNK